MASDTTPKQPNRKVPFAESVATQWFQPIRPLTTNQKVVGSNPAGLTSLKPNEIKGFGGFLCPSLVQCSEFLGHIMHSKTTQKQPGNNPKKLGVHQSNGFSLPFLRCMVINLEEHPFGGVTQPIHHGVDVDIFVATCGGKSVPEVMRTEVNINPTS